MKILIVNRDYNDIDHISPIAYKLKKFNYEVSILIANESIDYENDYRLSFLAKEGVNIITLKQFQSFNIKFLLLKTIKKIRYRYKTYWYRRICNSILERLSANIARVNIANEISSLFKPDVMLFDWTNPIGNHLRIIQYLFEYAKNNNIITFSLPHGLSIYLNCNMINNFQIKKDNYHPYNNYDYVVSNNVYFSRCLCKAGVKEEKVLLLGSARFCSEWINIHNKIYPKNNFLLKKNNKKNIVIFPQQSQYKVNIDLQIKMVKALDSIGDYNIYFKFHTRNHNDKYFNTLLKLENVILCDNSIVSSFLIDNADIIIAYGSSIVLEAIYKSKYVLYPKFLHKNKTIFDLYDKFICNSIEDLLEKVLYRCNCNINIEEEILSQIATLRRKDDILYKYIRLIESKYYKKY